LGEGQAAGGEIGRHVGVDPAEGEIGIGQARAGDVLKDVEDHLPVVEGVQDGGEGPEVEEVGPPPDEVRAYAVEFRNDDADVFGALGHLDAGQPLHGPGVGPIPGHGLQIIHPAHVGHELVIGPLLGHPFVHAMDVAEDGFGPQDVFAVQFEHDAQNPVRGGVLRPHAENQFVLGGPWFEPHGRAVAPQECRIEGVHDSSWPQASLGPVLTAGADAAAGVSGSAKPQARQ